MALERGSRIGAYEIVARLGAGAMGEVYRARDSRLQREVALKTMRDDVSREPDRRARFEREARVAAALNHPNILGAYEVGEHEGQLYFVTELVEGRTLRQRMEQGPIGLKELYRIAAQLADGMAAAHAAGIVHRDLKPENIMITPDNRVKILDFGLARQTEAADPAGTLTMAPGETIEGTVMGTAAYMSPEQARGAKADFRSDQFSFGAILYELASGESPFQRPTSVQTMSAVLAEDPKPLPANLPAPLRWTIARCLEKNAADRYDSTRDLHREISGQQEHLSEVFSTAAVEALPAPKRRPVWLAAAGAAVLLFGAGAYLAASRGDAPLKYTPMEVTWQSPSMAIWSPDGQAFAYTALVDNTRHAFVRYVNSRTPVRLTKGGESFVVLGWAPDGKRVVVSSRNPNGPNPPLALFSVAVTGGEPAFLSPFEEAASSVISADGRILAVLRQLEDKSTIVLTASPVGGELQRYPSFTLPSKAIFNAPTMRIAPDNSFLLLWVDDEKSRRLWRLPLPPGQGRPEPILEGFGNGAGATPILSYLPDGRHAIVTHQESLHEQHMHLSMLDLANGSMTRITGGTGDEVVPSVSPDGKRLLFSKRVWEYQLISMSLEDAGSSTVIRSERVVGMPAWAARKDAFAYVSDRNGPPEVWIREHGADRPLVTADTFSGDPAHWFLNPALSPDGDRVAYTRIGANNQTNIWISAVAGGSAIRLTADKVQAEYGGGWSPDGRQFALVHMRDGVNCLAVVKTTGEAASTVLRRDAVSGLPEWSPDGKWIRYRSVDRGWVLVSPDGREEQVFGKLEAENMAFSPDSSTLYGIRPAGEQAELFSLHLATRATRRIAAFSKDLMPGTHIHPGVRLSVSPDGKRILYATVKRSTSLWLLEGFRQPGWRGWFNR